MAREATGQRPSREVVEFLEELCGEELLRPLARMTIFFEKHRGVRPVSDRQRLLLDRVGTALAWLGAQDGPLEKSKSWLRLLNLVREIDRALARGDGRSLKTRCRQLQQLRAEDGLAPETAAVVERMVLLLELLAEEPLAAWRRRLWPGHDLQALQMGLLIRLGAEEAKAAAGDLLGFGASEASRMLRQRLRLAVWALVLAFYQLGIERLYQLALQVRDAVCEATADVGR